MIHRYLYYLIATLSILLSRHRFSHEQSHNGDQRFADSFSMDELFI
jgi:hypothetical protein